MASPSRCCHLFFIWFEISTVRVILGVLYKEMGQEQRLAFRMLLLKSSMSGKDGDFHSSLVHMCIYISTMGKLKDS